MLFYSNLGCINHPVSSGMIWDSFLRTVDCITRAWRKDLENSAMHSDVWLSTFIMIGIKNRNRDLWQESPCHQPKSHCLKTFKDRNLTLLRLQAKVSLCLKKRVL